MALAFIGEAAAAGIIGRLTEAAYTTVQENLLPAGDVEAERERLQYALPQIKAVLSAAESAEIRDQDNTLTTWMWQFRDAIEFADDVLDEMAYYELKKKIQKQNEKVGASAYSLKRKFIEFVGGKFRTDDHGILRKLAMAVKGLDKVASSMRNFPDLQRGSATFLGKTSEDKNLRNDRETGSMKTEGVVIGREKERDSIVEWLTANDPSSGDVTLSAFTIYGIGGLGKTTLAQLISNDGRIRQFFDPIIWVYVSDQFDAVTILGKIIEFLSEESPKVSSLTSLQDILKEKLRSKRFLLVLDDVWNDENRSQWEKVVAPLKFGYGKILMTTRMEAVANMAAKVIEGKMGHLKLGGLEEEEFFMLFKKYAFDGLDPDEFGNLIPIGKQITKKLGGCPLAAKIMGGVLNYSMEFDYWNKVLKEDVPNFHDAKDGIMIVLRLSYCHLPTYLQLCFRYCSIFPKDYKFKKDELIKMWMGSGLIEPTIERQIPEDVGREYFNRLVRKSFFDLNSENFYVMHDLLHDLAQSVSQGECLRIEKSSSDIPRTIRHLSFNMESLLSVREISHLNNLRTLFITFSGYNSNSNDDRNFFSEGLKGFKSLRLLRVIVIWEDLVQLPDTVGELIHLRYLSHEFPFQYTIGFLSWFPESVYKLYHLELIKFFTHYITNIKKLEINDMHYLIKLRHVEVSVMSIIRCPIRFIGKLTFLQELKSFCIEPKNGHMISELRDLRSLRKLVIYNLNHVSNPVEALEAKLNEKENLNNLSLIWSQDNCDSPGVDEQLVDNLQPHIYLQKLSINRYGGMRCPIWTTHLFLENLIFLELSSCFLLASLPELGKFTLLKHLRLTAIPRVKKIDQTFYGNGIECAFPVLQELTLHEMDELEYWEELQGIALFPRLEILSIYGCPKLRRLPSLSPSLKKLHIRKVGLEVLPKIYRRYNNGLIFSSCLSSLNVSGCPNLTSLVECLLQQQECLQALTVLYISECKGLMYFPSRGFIDFTSLEDVTIGECPLLVSDTHTQENLLPSSLQELSLGHNGLDIPLLGSIQNCTALTMLKLHGCPSISSLPPFENLMTLTALRSLSICYCPEVSSLNGLEALTSLRNLTIGYCDKLTTMSLSQPPLVANANDSNHLQLNELIIDLASLLLLEPLRTLRLTKNLEITDASGLTCMPEEWLLQNHSALRSIIVKDARSLEHVPSCMDKLRLLEHLAIYGAPLIQSLPDLPSSLTFLCILECHPALKERYRKDIGPEWHKIVFVSNVYIW